MLGITVPDGNIPVPEVFGAARFAICHTKIVGQVPRCVESNSSFPFVTRQHLSGMCIVAVTRTSQLFCAKARVFLGFVWPSTGTRTNWVLRFFVAGVSHFVPSPIVPFLAVHGDSASRKT